jgi:hypothetical protein
MMIFGNAKTVMRETPDVSKKSKPRNTPRTPDDPLKRPAYDQAALIGGALAAVLAIAQADGRWDFFDSVLGLAILVVLLTFYRPTQQPKGRYSLFERIALSAVLAAIGCVIAGVVVEWRAPHHVSATLAMVWVGLLIVLFVTTPWRYVFRRTPPPR